MVRILGDVLERGRVVVPSVAAWVEFVAGPAGRPGWCGYFELPAGTDLTAKGYEFLARDGRTGRVKVLWSLAGTDRRIHAEFRGAGPLATG
jgi:hypothetical protein